MARTTIKGFAVCAATVSVVALAGCEKGTGPFDTAPKAAGEATATEQRSTRIVDRDVEAPEAFQVTDAALWDGRPSLGGVWVASPEVTDPERVIMRNTENGKFVIGALFRRERENPGPTLQISSDAAEALGLLAGEPGTISVTALRREEAPEETPATPTLDTAEQLPDAGVTPDAVTPDAVTTGGIDTQPLEAAVAEAAGGAEAPTTPDPIAAEAIDGALTDPDAIATAGPPTGPEKKKFRWPWQKKAKPADETAAIAATALAAADGADEVTTEALPGARADIAAPAPAPAPAPAASGSSPIQIGFFSVEANAKRAVDTLAKAGVTSEMRSETAKGKTYWTVTARGDAGTLKQIKSAGFSDAYLLK